MDELFKLKKWLSIYEAAIHISNVLDEDVLIADLLRLALDGHLTLSANFVNHTPVKKGIWVKTEDVEFEIEEYSRITGEKYDIPAAFPKNNELKVAGDNWIRLEKSVVSIKGIWDLPMIGGEKLDIEHYYQQLTSGVEVKLVAMDGAFVQKDDAICQLQEDFDNNEFQEGSKAQEQHIMQFISNNKHSKKEANILRAKYKKDRKEYLEKRKKTPWEDNFYPAGGLPNDCVCVIRTNEITRFIQSLEDTPVLEKPQPQKNATLSCVNWSFLQRIWHRSYRTRSIYFLSIDD